jgi:hypothetical protein
MSDASIQNALAYANRYRLQLAERLGFGIHGIIYVADNKSAGGRTAIKPVAGVEHDRNHGIQHPATHPHGRRAARYRMTIVTRPFALDFAGAYLGALPKFSEEVWAEWEAARREQFELAWPSVRAVLDALEVLGIYMVDVSPSNISP